MTREQLKKRLKKIEATPLKELVKPIDVMRRGHNHIEMEQEEGLDYDDFFDFEKELADLESAREQAAKAASSHMFFEDTESEDDGPGFLVMEEAPSVIVAKEPDPEPVGAIVLDFEEEEVQEELVQNEDKKVDVKTPEFKQCVFMKSDGEQCKRQAPKKHDMCSSHRKMLAKQTS